MSEESKSSSVHQGIYEPILEINHAPEGEQIKYEIGFNLKGVHSSIANSLRRTMLSEIPNVGFDPTPFEDLNDNSIRMIANTSAIHNEFMSHRLGLVPICTYLSGAMNIHSFWDSESSQRKHRFVNGDGELPDEEDPSEGPRGVPIFLLDVSNDLKTRNHLKGSRPNDIEDSTVCVTTEDLTFHPRETERVDNFIVPDIQTNEFIILNKLKLLSSGVGEKLKIQCVPTIGTGNQHALYSPVGTVSYSFIQDTGRMEEVFDLYQDKIKHERLDKGLKPYTDDELEEFKQNFDSLDAKRVVVRDSSGEPNAFKFNVESIGGMFPAQIVSFGIKTLKNRCSDILRCCKATRTDKGPVYELTPDKLSIQKCLSKMDGFDILINGEDHTFGNMISKHLQSFYQGVNCSIKKLISFVSYNKPHPLKDQIIVRMKLSDEINCVNLIKFISENKELLDPRLREGLEGLDKLDDYECVKFCTVFIFIQGVNGILDVLSQIDSKWDTLSNKWLQDPQIVPNPNFITFTKTSMEVETWYPNIGNKSTAMYLKMREFQ